jgi:hypothetical protein
LASISCGFEVVCAFLLGEEIADLSNGVPEFIDRAHGDGARLRLKFGEGHFVGIEVGAVGRRKQRPRAGVS